MQQAKILVEKLHYRYAIANTFVWDHYIVGGGKFVDKLQFSCLTQFCKMASI